MEEAGEGEKARWALHSERVGPPRATHRQDLPSANREGMCLDERFPPPLCPRREELLCLLAFPFVPCQVLAAHEIDTSLGLGCFHSSNECTFAHPFTQGLGRVLSGLRPHTPLSRGVQI